MNKFIKILILIAVLVGLGLLFWQIPSNQKVESEAKVAATIFPIYDITKNIVGNEMDVALILPPGASPHTYEPTPSDVQSLSNVEVVYAVSYEFDGWANSIAQSNDAKIVLLDSSIELMLSHDTDKIDDADPHYWLTIANAQQIAMTITIDLSRRYPESANNFAKNLSDYSQELAATDEQIRSVLNSVPNKNLITMHNAWYYFAQEYGLNVAGAFEPTAGREPTPQYLIELIDAIKSAEVKTLYSEPQLDNAPLESFIKDNNLTLAILDPIGGVEGRQSYIQLMLYNAQTIAQNQ